MAVPHCVQFASGMPPTTPDCDQSTARVGARMPVQACACKFAAKHKELASTIARCFNLISSPQAAFEERICPQQVRSPCARQMLGGARFQVYCTLVQQ